MPRTDLLHVLLRRWYVVLAGLLVTVALASGAIVLVPAKYSATADVLLLPPPAPNALNPYIALDGLQPFAASFAPSVLNDDAVRKLQSEGITRGYSIIADTTTPAPLLLVTTSGKSGAAAIDALNKVTALISPALVKFQTGVTTKNQVISQTTFADTTAKTVRKSQTRALLVAIVAGLVITGLAAVSIDRVLLARRRRPAGGQQAGRGAQVEADHGLDWVTQRARAAAPLSSREMPPMRRPKRKKAGGDTDNPPSSYPSSSETPRGTSAPTNPVARPDDVTPPSPRPESPNQPSEPPDSNSANGRVDPLVADRSNALRDRAIHRSRRQPRSSPTAQNSHD